MGYKVQLIQEIYNRIYTATQTGGALKNVKRVFVGCTEEVRKQVDLPIVMIKLDSGNETQHQSQRLLYDEMKIFVHLFCAKLTGKNTLFNDAGTDGALVLLEKLLNVIEKDTLGNVDNTYGLTTGWVPQNFYYVDESEDIVEIRVEYTFKTRDFSLGGR